MPPINVNSAMNSKAIFFFVIIDVFRVVEKILLDVKITGREVV
jgi:hypothetical protein